MCVCMSDVQLLLCTTRACVKLLEESAAQKEMRARQECEDLMERLATVTRVAEQERTELQAQHQRKLAQAQQDRDREVERLRDLQRYHGELSLFLWQHIIERYNIIRITTVMQ